LVSPVAFSSNICGIYVKTLIASLESRLVEHPNADADAEGDDYVLPEGSVSPISDSSLEVKISESESQFWTLQALPEGIALTQAHSSLVDTRLFPSISSGSMISDLLQADL